MEGEEENTEEKKNEILDKAKKHYYTNKEQIASKLYFFTKKFEDIELLKESVEGGGENDCPEQESSGNSIVTKKINLNIEKLDELSKRNIDNPKIELTDYKFNFEESNKFSFYINCITDLTTKVRMVNLANNQKTVNFLKDANVREKDNEKVKARDKVTDKAVVEGKNKEKDKKSNNQTYNKDPKEPKELAEKKYNLVENPKVKQTNRPYDNYEPKET